VETTAQRAASKAEKHFRRTPCRPGNAFQPVTRPDARRARSLAAIHFDDGPVKARLIGNAYRSRRGSRLGPAWCHGTESASIPGGVAQVAPRFAALVVAVRWLAAKAHALVNEEETVMLSGGLRTRTSFQ
jgi:hypothetical protein